MYTLNKLLNKPTRLNKKCVWVILNIVLKFYQIL